MSHVEPITDQLLPNADRAHAPLARHTGMEWMTALEMVRAQRGRSRLRNLPKGDGHPVLVLPGFLAGRASTKFLRNVLRDLGYYAHDWHLGTNLGVNPEVEDKLRTRVNELYDQHQRKISLIGWSAGGIYSREVAREYPDLVRNVITLGSPIRGNVQASRAWRLYRAVNRGEHLESLMSDEAKFGRAEPLPVPTTCIYSRTDGIVSWECCTSLPAPTTENIEVSGTHLGYGHNMQVLRIIADRLALPEGDWIPYRRLTTVEK